MAPECDPGTARGQPHASTAFATAAHHLCVLPPRPLPLLPQMPKQTALPSQAVAATCVACACSLMHPTCRFGYGGLAGGSGSRAICVLRRPQRILKSRTFSNSDGSVMATASTQPRWRFRSAVGRHRHHQGGFGQIVHLVKWYIITCNNVMN